MKYNPKATRVPAAVTTFRVPGPVLAFEPEGAADERYAVVRLRLQGYGVDAIATELGLMSVDALAELVGRLNTIGANVHRGRRRSIGAEAEAEMRRLRGEG
jgi:hypothetical protein